MHIQILYGWRRCLGYSQSWKEQCHEIFDFGFFHESSSPQPQNIPLGPFRIFPKIRSSRCTTDVVDTGGKSIKSSISNLFKKNFEHLWLVESTCRCIFFFKFTLRCQQSDSVPIICHRCHWYRWCTLTCKYLREFLKKFEMTLMSEAWGKKNYSR